MSDADGARAAKNAEAFCSNCMRPLRSGGPCPYCGGVAREGAPHLLRPGTLLVGRYLVGNVVGQGGFGITYIGRDLTLDVRIAVKEYYPTGYANRNTESSNMVTASGEAKPGFFAEGKLRFLDEARVLARFSGEPGIVDVRDYFEANDTAYIIMEYLEGESLRDRIARETLSADSAFGLMRPVMDTLEKIHAENVVHRDISPDNIMILRDGSLKLADFGAARRIDYASPRSLSVMLKTGYAPEEQYRAHGPQGPWTDVYALCATIYKAITGKTPDDALQRLHRDDLLWPSELGIPISAAQELALKRGMSVRAEERLQTIGELRACLDADDATVFVAGSDAADDEPGGRSAGDTTVCVDGGFVASQWQQPQTARYPSVEDAGQRPLQPVVPVYGDAVYGGAPVRPVAPPVPSGGAGPRARGIVIAVVSAVVLAACFVAGCYFMGASDGLVGCVGQAGRSESSTASSSTASEAVQVASGAGDFVACSAATRIVPCSTDGVPYDEYRAELVPLAGSSSGGEFPELRIRGTGGFVLDDFSSSSSDSEHSVAVGQGTYEVVMTDAATGGVCRARVDYRFVDAAAPEALEILAS